MNLMNWLPLLSADVSYIGETTWIGLLGHLLIVLLFVGYVISAIANYNFVKHGHSGWDVMGRWSFASSSIAHLVVVILFFVILSNHMFEYYYVYANTSETLAFRYVFAAFWKDQEGSIMLWMFWNVVIGFFILFREHQFKHGVLSYLSVLQAMMSSMLLGIVLQHGEDPLRLGLDPFRLLRHEFHAPIFEMADYLNHVQGSGLNPSLQNYWMTIHPPTVFFGFALCTVPVGFVVAGVWKREWKEWAKPAYHWALFGCGVLGTGILMGSVWAYEALNFGGYWAWDPVENMSLVPWLLLVAGLHTNLIAIKTGRSYAYSFVFYALATVSVLYSSYLTKSGVLGDTSVHSFTEMGLGTQLMLIVVVFSGLFIYQLVRYWKRFPYISEEETFWSKEFWLFLGTLTLILSSALITFSTSIPVFNKIIDLVGMLLDKDLSDWHRTIPLNAEKHHNQYQLWIAVLISILSAIGVYLRWNERHGGARFRSLFTRIIIVAVIGVIISWGVNQWLDLVAWQYMLLLWSAWLGILLNIDFVLFFERSNWRKLATSMSHLGFSIMILGIMFSGIKKRHISVNDFVFSEILGDEQENKHVYLIRDAPIFIRDGYEVTYTRDSLIGNQRHYYVNFERRDTIRGVVEQFTTSPSVIYNNEFTKVASVNPSTKHYWNRDVFTHIASLPIAQMDAEKARELEDSLNYQLLNLLPGDTIYSFGYLGTVRELVPVDEVPGVSLGDDDKAFGLDIDFVSTEGRKHRYTARTFIILIERDGVLVTVPHRDNTAGIKVKLDERVGNVLFAPEDSLSYEVYEVALGEEFVFEDRWFRLDSVRPSTEEDYGQLEEEDVAITAIISEKGRDSGIYTPTFVVRNRNIIPVRDYNIHTRTAIKLLKVNPDRSTFDIAIAENKTELKRIPIYIAENVSRDDFLVLEAIVFPGINLFWLGTVMMMLGFFIALMLRRKEWTSQ